MKDYITLKLAICLAWSVVFCVRFIMWFDEKMSRIEGRKQP